MALRRYFWTVPLACVAFGGALPVVRAGALRKVWEVDLAKAIGRAGVNTGFPIFAARFSPDGRKLAVIADFYETQAARKSRLLVIDVERPTTGVRQFEIEWGILENESGRAPNFGWASSGEIIYALGTVIHLSSGSSCELPSRSVFISDDLAVSARAYPPPLYSSTRLAFFDQNCEERGEWEVSEGWLVSDVSTDRGLLSVLKETNNPAETERLIVDPVGRKVLQRWHENVGGAWEFADGGKAVCQGGSVLQSDHAPARCRDVDTGKEIGETLRNGVEPIAAAERATRVVVSDYQRRKIPFDYEYRTTFKGRYIWDFGTGKELASWMPESETYQNVFASSRQVTELFRFAISPDGQYVAEGGNGIIRLYRIEP
jgi:hypothetical protein